MWYIFCFACAGASSGGESSSTLEQRKYLSLLVAATPSSYRSNALMHTNSDSLTSLDSLMMVGMGGDPINLPATPELARRGTRGDSADKRVSAPAPSAVSTAKSKNACKCLLLLYLFIGWSIVDLLY